MDDLTPCIYLPVADSSGILAVGWLSAGRDFRHGPMERKLYDKLVEFARNPWQPFVAGGSHQCDLCQFDGAGGAANLYFPWKDQILVCPELIVHYIACHHYLPPDDFLEAVRDCPPMRSQEYRKALVATGRYRALTTPPGNMGVGK